MERCASQCGVGGDRQQAELGPVAVSKAGMNANVLAVGSLVFDRAVDALSQADEGLRPTALCRDRLAFRTFLGSCFGNGCSCGSEVQNSF